MGGLANAELYHVWACPRIDARRRQTSFRQPACRAFSQFNRIAGSRAVRPQAITILSYASTRRIPERQPNGVMGWLLGWAYWPLGCGPKPIRRRQYLQEPNGAPNGPRGSRVVQVIRCERSQDDASPASRTIRFQAEGGNACQQGKMAQRPDRIA